MWRPGEGGYSITTEERNGSHWNNCVTLRQPLACKLVTPECFYDTKDLCHIFRPRFDTPINNSPLSLLNTGTCYDALIYRILFSFSSLLLLVRLVALHSTYSPGTHYSPLSIFTKLSLIWPKPTSEIYI